MTVLLAHKSLIFDKAIYDKRVYDSKGVAHPEVNIQFGPNIKDWPKMTALTDNLVLKVITMDKKHPKELKLTEELYNTLIKKYKFNIQ